MKVEQEPKPKPEPKQEQPKTDEKPKPIVQAQSNLGGGRFNPNIVMPTGGAKEN